MRRTRSLARSTALVATLLLSLLPATDQTAEIDAFKHAEAFENSPAKNASEVLDEVVVLPAMLESEKANMSEEPEPRVLQPMEVSSTTSQDALPYGGALVAVEATALLVGGATIVVVVGAKIKARASLAQYEETEEVNPMLQSLLYSDMDYAAI